MGVRGEGSNPADGYRVGVPDIDFCGTESAGKTFFTNFSLQKETVEAGRTYYRSRKKKNRDPRNATFTKINSLN